jgi:hypothetical protein
MLPAQNNAGKIRKTEFPASKIIYLRERSITMLKNDLIQRNPLRLIGSDSGKALGPGEFGAVLAKAGIGKTAVLVQIALDNLLNGKNVLHVSLDQPVRKVCLWYEEIFSNISQQYDIKNTSRLWDEILPHRFIMTFNNQTFSITQFEERVNDLVEQGIFFPQLLLLDGLPFDESARELITELKIMAKDMKFPVWMAIKIGAEEDIKPGMIPTSVAETEDMFTTMIALKTISKDIVDVYLLKGGDPDKVSSLVVDPATLLIKNRE